MTDIKEKTNGEEHGRYYVTQEKLEALARVKAGQRQLAVANSFQISRTTLVEWMGHMAPTDWSNAVKISTPEKDLLDRALYTWFMQQLQVELRPTEESLLKKANIFAVRLYGRAFAVDLTFLKMWCARHCISLADTVVLEPDQEELDRELEIERKNIHRESLCNGTDPGAGLKKLLTEKNGRKRRIPGESLLKKAAVKNNSKIDVSANLEQILNSLHSDDDDPDDMTFNGSKKTPKKILPSKTPPPVNGNDVSDVSKRSGGIGTNGSAEALVPPSVVALSKHLSAGTKTYSKNSNSPLKESLNGGASDKDNNNNTDGVSEERDGDASTAKRARRNSSDSEKENDKILDVKDSELTNNTSNNNSNNSTTTTDNKRFLKLAAGIDLVKQVNEIIKRLKPKLVSNKNVVIPPSAEERVKATETEVDKIEANLSLLSRFPMNFRAALLMADESLPSGPKKHTSNGKNGLVKVRDGMLPSDVEDNHLPIEYTNDVIHVGQNKLERQHLPPFGAVVRPDLKPAMQVYAAKTNTLGVWARAKVVEVKIVNLDGVLGLVYRVKFESKKNGGSRVCPPKLLAYTEPPNVTLPVGSRVIARYKDDTGEFYSALYAGIIAEPPKSTNNLRYLIFFDDGYAQYVRHFEVYLVCSGKKEVWEEINDEGAKKFVCSYLKQYPERPMVKLARGQSVLTEWNGHWWNAKVMRVDGSLVEMYFDSDKRTEWIYRGSLRLSPLFNEVARTEAITQSGKPMRRHNTMVKKKDRPYVEYTRDKEHSEEESRLDSPDVIPIDSNDDNDPKPQTARKHTGEVKQTARKSTTQDAPMYPKRSSFYATIDPAKAISQMGETETCEVQTSRRIVFAPHKCSVNCVITEDPTKHKGQNPLRTPMLCGWQREIVKQRPGSNRVVFYRAPCGRRFRYINEVAHFLSVSNSKLTVDFFCFDTFVHIFSQFKPVKICFYVKDMTYGKEPVPVCCVNSLDKSNPPYVEYSSKRYPAKGVTLNIDPEFLCCCDCEDDCQNREKCQCAQLTITASGATPVGPIPDAGYKFRRLAEPLVTGIYECNPRCKCRSSCFNRVAQNGLQARLQVFKTEQRGWGIRCLDDVPQGMFLCIYAGQLLNEQLANEDGNNYGDEYQAELDHIEVVERYKEGYESDVEEDEKELEDVKPRDDVKFRPDSDSDESPPTSPSRALHTDADFDSLFNTNATMNNETQSSYSFRKRTSERITSRDDNNSSSSDSRSKSSDSSKLTIKSRSNSLDDTKKDKPILESKVPAIVSVTSGAAVEKFRSTRTFFNEEYCYIMDAKICGNIGRYLNHSCTPNVFVQNVFVDTHDLRFPWVAFFASCYIRAGTELTWDYNYDVGSVPGKVMYCHCGSTECRGRLL